MFTNTPRETQVAWAAGILEGEGSFIDREGYGIQATASMTDLDVLTTIQDVLGGSVLPDKRRNSEWKPSWTWRVSGTKCYLVLIEILPYMHSRRSKKIEYLIQKRQPYEDFLVTRQINKEVAISKILNNELSVKEAAKTLGLSQTSIYRWLENT